MPESRAPRRDYLRMNDGSDEEGDSDDSQPPRSRRRIDPAPEITLNESVSQVNELVSQAPSTNSNTGSLVSQSSSSRRGYKPKSKDSWLWNSFHVIDLEKDYFHKTARVMRPDKLITCSICNNWSTTEAVLQGSLSNLGYHLKKTHRISKPGTVLQAPSTRTTPNITSFLVQQPQSQPQVQVPVSVLEQLEKNILRWIVVELEPFSSVEALTFQQIFNDLPGIDLPFKSATTVKHRLVAQLKDSREHLKQELDTTCTTIGLSLDV